MNKKRSDEMFYTDTSVYSEGFEVTLSCKITDSSYFDILLKFLSSKDEFDNKNLFIRKVFLHFIGLIN
jgi:hypothetical protein